MSIPERVSTELVHAPGAGGLSPLAGRARGMTIEQLQAETQQVRDLVKAVLVEGTDYGNIPGVTRPSLFKSGAELLLRRFGYGHRIGSVEIERDDEGHKYGVTYRITVHDLNDPDVVLSECDGYCGYDEDKYFQTAAQLEQRERANAQKYQRAPKPEKWLAGDYKAPWNTVIKMAIKRALVGATIQATATSGLFTQDMEDHRGTGGDAPSGQAGTDPRDAHAQGLGWDTFDQMDEAHAGRRRYLKQYVDTGNLTSEHANAIWQKVEKRWLTRDEYNDWKAQVDAEAGAADPATGEISKPADAPETAPAVAPETADEELDRLGIHYDLLCTPEELLTAPEREALATAAERHPEAFQARVEGARERHIAEATARAGLVADQAAAEKAADQQPDRMEPYGPDEEGDEAAALGCDDDELVAACVATVERMNMATVDKTLKRYGLRQTGATEERRERLSRRLIRARWQPTV